MGERRALGKRRGGGVAELRVASPGLTPYGGVRRGEHVERGEREPLDEGVDAEDEEPDDAVDDAGDNELKCCEYGVAIPSALRGECNGGRLSVIRRCLRSGVAEDGSDA